MYGDKCERCGSEGVGYQTSLLRLVPIILCYKCRRLFDSAIRATHEWAEYIKMRLKFDNMEKRAAVADANDTTFWACYEAASNACEDATEAARKWAATWAHAECDAPKKGAEPDA